jgi:hypothetical protein
MERVGLLVIYPGAKKYYVPEWCVRECVCVDE